MSLERPAKRSFAYPSANDSDKREAALPAGSQMKDHTEIRQRLEAFRGQLLNWGTPDLQVSVTTKDELRGWIRALEWVLGKL